ncbi:MAG: hypothetical protein HY894_02670 [Deltaproteobacteria bacterium]|nr:hypothetical protein [Deltaproteobacteria bacterium]
MFEQTLSRIGAALAANGLPYMVIGGQAALLYGNPRLTRDIDVTLGAGMERLAEVLRVAQGLRLRILPDDPDGFVRRTMVLPAADEATGIRVDFIFSFTPYESEAIGRAKGMDIAGQTVYFASPEDLVIHKIFAGRPRDMEDVRAVLVKNSGMDLAYIRRWLAEFDAGIDRGGFLAAFEDILKNIG